MIQSMTGFCKIEVQYLGKHCSIEMRSVNHRYLDARIFLPKAFAAFEESLKKRLKTHLSRGKVDVSLTLEDENNHQESLGIDEQVLGQFKTTLNDLESSLGKEVQVSLNDLLQVKGLLKYELPDQEDYDYNALFNLALDQGAEALTTMRLKEGTLLQVEILAHVAFLSEQISQVAPWAQEVQTGVQARLSQGLMKLGLDLDLNEPRVMQEIGFQMDRADVTEEIERFQIHLLHLKDILDSNKPVGRKLDFLMQELHREANTLCSKAAHPKITEIGVTLKSELEKVREQIQNIE